MSFRTSAAFTAAMADKRPSLAVVTGGRSGIGLALAKKIASFDFIDQVLAVSRSAKQQELELHHPKLVAVPADISTEEGRQVVVDKVKDLCGDKKQLRFLIHSAGSIDPIKPVFELKPEELRQSMVLNCEAPLFLTTSLYTFMKPLDDKGVPGRVLHVSSGAAHGAPPVGWAAYGIGKAAFFQSYLILEREFREAGGHVVVGSFKPGVVNTAMQGVIRDAPEEAMPIVGNFRGMKAKADAMDDQGSRARPPPAGALDSPENVAFFAEYLLVGTTDSEFADASDSKNEFDIRNKELYPKWIDAADLPN